MKRWIAGLIGLSMACWCGCGEQEPPKSSGSESQVKPKVAKAEKVVAEPSVAAVKTKEVDATPSLKKVAPEKTDLPQQPLNQDRSCPTTPRKVVRAVGYVRGSGMVTLRSKYDGFVARVYHYSHEQVKKGDVILEYDDFDLRKQILNKERELAELEQDLVNKELQLQIKKLDPLPSNYRNVNGKLEQAKELLLRREHEWKVYQHLRESGSISELSLREKTQAFYNAKSEYANCLRDLKVVEQGLSEKYVRASEEELIAVKTKVAFCRRQLEQLYETSKYYKIIAPCDGECVTNSDTVGGYNAEGTVAARVHSCDKGKLVYAYVSEADLPAFQENMECRFWSNQLGCHIKCRLLEIDCNRVVYGDKSCFLLKLVVESRVEDLRLESAGYVEPLSIK